MCGTAEEPETKSDFPSKLWFSAKLTALQIPGSQQPEDRKDGWRSLQASTQARRAGRPEEEEKSFTPILLTWKELGSAHRI